MNDRIKIEQGTKVPADIAESVDEIEAEHAGIESIVDMLVRKSALNRLRNERMWRDVNERFDLQGKRWRISRSPKTELEWVFEELDSCGLDTRAKEGE